MDSKTLEELQAILATITSRLNETSSIILFFEECKEIDIATSFDANIVDMNNAIECLNKEIDSRL